MASLSIPMVCIAAIGLLGDRQRNEVRREPRPWWEGCGAVH